MNHQCSDSDGEPAKKMKAVNRHLYPALVPDADDDTSNSRNMTLLEEEIGKQEPNQESLKMLMCHTYCARRPTILESEFKVMLKRYPVLKKSAYVSIHQMHMPIYSLISRLLWSLE